MRTPDFSAEGAALYRGDCLDVLRGMESESVDALVTDPPFGIGFDYSGTREVTSDPASYWEWLRPRYEEALRCVKPGGFVAVWQAQPNFRHFWEWFGEGIKIYAACKNFVQLRKTPINYGYDPVVMFYKSGAEPLRPAKPARSIDFFVANTAAVISDTTRIEKGHPCPRPLDQVEAILENFVLPGGTVLDPFVGSGTTGKACLNTGRSFIGIENHEPYFCLAQRRLSAELRRAPLLASAGNA